MVEETTLRQEITNLHDEWMDEIHKVHQVLDDHNKDEFIYRQQMQRQHQEIMAMLSPMSTIFKSVTGFNGVAVWILKAIVLFGAGLGVLWGAIKWLKTP